MPDEPIWGQYRRMLWLNGAEAMAAAATRPSEESATQSSWPSSRYVSACVELLAASSADADLKRYFLRHSLHSQLFGPLELSLLNWRYLLSLWNRHSVGYGNARRVFRFCPECSQFDSAHHGFAWFKRAHQYPGIEWCLLHSAGLVEVERYASFRPGDHGTDWYRPSSRQTTSKSVPPSPFIERYVLGLSWLHETKNRAEWQDLARAAKGRFRDSKQRNSLLHRITARIQDSAPRPWLQRNFSGRLMLRAERSCTIALLVAAATDSFPDLEGLLTYASCNGSKERRAELGTADDRDPRELDAAMRTYEAWLAEERDRAPL